MNSHILTTYKQENEEKESGFYSTEKKGLLNHGIQLSSCYRLPSSTHLRIAWGIPQDISDEIGVTVNLVLRDFINSWFRTFSSDDEFPGDIKILISDLIGALCKKLQAIDVTWVLEFLDEIANLVRLHLSWFREVHLKLVEESPAIFKSNDITPEILEQRHSLLLHHLQKTNRLHPALFNSLNRVQGEEEEKSYLRHIAVQVLGQLLPLLHHDIDNSKNILVLSGLHLGREILTCVILKPILGFCEAYYLNSILIQAIHSFSSRPKTSEDPSKEQLPSIERMGSKGSCTYNANPRRISRDWATGLAANLSLISDDESEDDLLISPLSDKEVSPKLRTPPSSTKIVKEESTPAEMADKNNLIDDLEQNLDVLLMKTAGASHVAEPMKELQDFVRSVEKILLQGFISINNDENPDYWEYIKQERWRTPFVNARVIQVENIPQRSKLLWAASPKGSEWILICIEEGELWEYFTSLDMDFEITAKYYSPTAALRNSTCVARILGILLRMNEVKFVISRSYMQDDSSEAFEFIYENERYIPLQGWTKALSIPQRPAWSDLTGKIRLDKYHYPLPNAQWRWAGEWKIDYSRNDKKEKVESSPKSGDLKSLATTNNTDKSKCVNMKGEKAVSVDRIKGIERNKILGKSKSIEKNKVIEKSRSDKDNFVDKGNGVDKDGWEYASSFGDEYHAVNKPFDSVRRRRWFRQRCKSIDQDELQFPIKQLSNVTVLPLANDTICGKCGVDIGTYGVISRKRCHCKKCGGAFCDSCLVHASQTFLPTSNLKGNKHRVCDTCFETLPTPPSPQAVPEIKSFSTSDDSKNHHRKSIPRARTSIRQEKKMSAEVIAFDTEITADNLTFDPNPLFCIQVRVYGTNNVNIEREWMVKQRDKRFIELHQSLLKRMAYQKQNSLFHINHVNYLEMQGIDPPQLLSRESLKKCPEICAFLTLEMPDPVEVDPFKKSDKSKAISSKRLSLGNGTHMGTEKLERIEMRLYSLVDEVFELEDLSTLRKNILTIAKSVVRMSLRGSLYRYVRTNYLHYTTSKQLALGIQQIREWIWPNGQLLEKMTPIDGMEKIRKFQEVRDAILDSLPAALVSLLGEGCCRNGFLKIHEFMQYESMVKNLAFSILDVFILKLFPDLKQSLHGDLI